ncbi:hypothetical protein [Vibrio phage RYC]|nr:hypothetical protein [Vibrio phage RYC]
MTELFEQTYYPRDFNDSYISGRSYISEWASIEFDPLVGQVPQFTPLVELGETLPTINKDHCSFLDEELNIEEGLYYFEFETIKTSQSLNSIDVYTEFIRMVVGDFSKQTGYNTDNNVIQPFLGRVIQRHQLRMASSRAQSFSKLFIVKMEEGDDRENLANAVSPFKRLKYLPPSHQVDARSHLYRATQRDNNAFLETYGSIKAVKDFLEGRDITAVGESGELPPHTDFENPLDSGIWRSYQDFVAYDPANFQLSTQDTSYLSSVQFLAAGSNSDNIFVRSRFDVPPNNQLNHYMYHNYISYRIADNISFRESERWYNNNNISNTLARETYIPSLRSEARPLVETVMQARIPNTSPLITQATWSSPNESAIVDPSEVELINWSYRLKGRILLLHMDFLGMPSGIQVLVRSNSANTILSMQHPCAVMNMSNDYLSEFFLDLSIVGDPNTAPPNLGAFTLTVAILN